MLEYQFGFRKGYSTEKAILEITDTLKVPITKLFLFSHPNLHIKQ